MEKWGRKEESPGAEFQHSVATTTAWQVGRWSHLLRAAGVRGYQVQMSLAGNYPPHMMYTENRKRSRMIYITHTGCFWCLFRFLFSIPTITCSPVMVSIGQLPGTRHLGKQCSKQFLAQLSKSLHYMNTTWRCAIFVCICIFVKNYVSSNIYKVGRNTHTNTHIHT